MSDFREQLARDVEECFLSLDEFAELVEIDGVVVPAIIEDKSETGSAFYNQGIRADGVSVRVRAVYVGEGVIPKPWPLQEMRIGDEAWIVSNAEPQMGMLKITLYRNES